MLVLVSYLSFRTMYSGGLMSSQEMDHCFFNILNKKWQCTSDKSKLLRDCWVCRSALFVLQRSQLYRVWEHEGYDCKRYDWSGMIDCCCELNCREQASFELLLFEHWTDCRRTVHRVQQRKTRNRVLPKDRATTQEEKKREKREKRNTIAWELCKFSYETRLRNKREVRVIELNKVRHRGYRIAQLREAPTNEEDVREYESGVRSKVRNRRLKISKGVWRKVRNGRATTYWRVICQATEYSVVDVVTLKLKKRRL